MKHYIILLITYPLAITTGPDVMQLTASLCIKGTAEAVESVVYDLNTHVNYESNGDSWEKLEKISLQSWTPYPKDGYASIKYSVSMYPAKPISIATRLMFGMKNIVEEYPPDRTKYIRFSLTLIKNTITPRITKHVSFASLPIEDPSSLVTQD